MTTLPCEGNCRFGDYQFVGVDAALAYDGSRCGCKPCPNLRLCHMWLPPEYMDIHRGRCGNCNVTFRKNLVFVDTTPETCCICLEKQTVFVQHPAGCGHTMCLGCFREQWWPNNTAFVNPRAFGFATTCACEYCSDKEDWPCEKAIKQWKQTNPADEAAWRQEETQQQAALEAKLEARSDPQKCPLCRKHLLDASDNSWTSWADDGLRAGTFSSFFH